MVGLIAAKLMLQKALFKKIDAKVPGFILSPAQFPLSSAASPTGIVYRSAIALKLAAQISVFADIAAYDLSEHFVKDLPLENRNLPITWTDWSMQRQDSGWIFFTLSDHGISKWLEHLCSELAERSLVPFADTSSTNPNLPLPKLCRQLRLSLPMFLQWSYVRCYHWGQYLADSQHQQVQATGTHTPASLSWGWSAESPLPCHQLLQVLCAAVDRIAASSVNPQTLLAQGYAVAAAFHQLQGTLPRKTVHGLSPVVQTSIWSLTQAVHYLLAQVIATIYHQKPALSF